MTLMMIILFSRKALNCPRLLKSVFVRHTHTHKGDGGRELSWRGVIVISRPAASPSSSCMAWWKRLNKQMSPASAPPPLIARAHSISREAIHCTRARLTQNLSLSLCGEARPQESDMRAFNKLSISGSSWERREEEEEREIEFIS